MKLTLTLFISILFSFHLSGQIAKTQVLQINAKPSTTGTTLEWNARSFTGRYLIYKRNNLSTNDWGNAIATVPSNNNSYTDNNLTPGKAAEYRVVQVNGSNQSQSFGYIYAGNQYQESIIKKGIILMIDSTFITSLKTEVERLTEDLELEDWLVYTSYAGRNETPVEVKAKIKQITDNNAEISTLFLLGHIAVPYSGDFSASSSFPPPDGHVEGVGNHTGAWAADAYYGDLDGTWTDLFVERETGNQNRNHNVVGDGKFDQSRIPSDLELEVGRVDLFDMPIFTKSETELLRSYLDRNHIWRTQKRTARQRAVIDNNFGGFNLASTGYHNFSTFFDLDSIADGDYFTNLENGSHLWSYGCGAGSYTRANGIGTTTDFRDKSPDNVFTILAGSFFGDWDVRNNFLRAPLGNNALASFWGGIPKWYIHTMGLGKHIGFGTRVSANNKTFYFNGAFNNSYNLIHIALMGDPTLKNAHLPQVKSLSANSANNQVQLNWTSAKGNFDGYAVYRVNPDNGNYVRITEKPVSDTFYTDESNWFTNDYVYTVRAIRLETTGSGSYVNIGGGVEQKVKHVNNLDHVETNQNVAYPSPNSTGVFKLRNSNIKETKIYDLQGRTISHLFTNHTIKLDNIAKGTYLLKLTYQNGQTAVQKVQVM